MLEPKGEGRVLGKGEEKKRREMEGADWEGCKGTSPESKVWLQPNSPPAGKTSFIPEMRTRKERLLKGVLACIGSSP